MNSWAAASRLVSPLATCTAMLRSETVSIVHRVAGSAAGLNAAGLGTEAGALPVPSQTTAPAVTSPSYTASHRTAWAPDASTTTDSARADGVPSSGSAQSHSTARSAACTINAPALL